jgi:hypothetical protein
MLRTANLETSLRAREERADLMADDILRIADDGRLDTTNGRLAAACAT